MRRSSSASPVETSWMTAGMAGLEIGLDGADQRGAFHGGQEMAEEALLGPLESATARRTWRSC